MQFGAARRVALTAAYGGLGVTAAGAVATGVLIGQAMIARRIIPPADKTPPACDGLYGGSHQGEPLRMTIIGDSSAAGYGVESPRHTLGALLATGLSEQLHRPVELHCVAVVGSESRHLIPQIERALERPPQLAVILIGANDVTHRQGFVDAVRALSDAVRRLRAVGAEVVVGTCPDLGSVQPIQPPLRWLARRWSRQLALAQTVAVVAAGGRTVSLGDLLGPAFAAEPDRMFSSDRFHPSIDGYIAASAALLPTAVAALTEPVVPSTPVHADEGVRTLPQAAADAVSRSGTEVSPVPSVSGRRGRWAQLRHRAWRYVGRPTDPTHVPLPQEGGS
jgi:lysophospholipase L1-like esterase